MPGDLAFRGLAEVPLEDVVELSSAALLRPLDLTMLHARYAAGLATQSMQDVHRPEVEKTLRSGARGSPQAPGAFGLGAYREERLVGFLGATVQRFCSPSGSHLGAQLGDAMTHPSCRRRGMFKQLVLRLRDELLSAGVAFEFGFPNQRSAPAFFGELDWTPVAQFSVFRLAAPRASLSLVRCIPVVRAVATRRARVLVRRLSVPGGLPSSAPQSALRVVRDEEYRHAKSPGWSEVIELAGRRVWLKPTATNLQVGDWDDQPHGSLGDTVRALARLNRQLCYSEATFQVQQQSDLFRHLTSLGPGQPTWRVGAFPLAEDLCAHPFYLTGGDVDTF